ncbi:MAG: hypothetical protein NVSMB21_18210 [Vulcanimicrobiaceae bacterium]
MATALACATFIFATIAAASAAAIVSIRSVATSNGGARLLVAFSGGVPTYNVYGNGTAEISLLLLGTGRAPNASANVDGAGPLSGASLSSAGDSQSLALHLAAPGTVRVSTGPGTTLIVDIPRPSPAANASPAPFGGAAPPATSAPTGGARAVEVVPLKYADVSEVVGILVAGQSIPSNDSFSPQSSNFGSAPSGFSGGIGTGGGFSSPFGANTVQSAGLAQGLGQRINEQIAIDRRLNAIVLSGTTAEVAAFKALIEKIDLPLSSVVLETEIVELTNSAAKDAGIDYTSGGGPLSALTYKIGSLATGQGSGGLQAAIFDQVSHGRGRIVAKPRIVALNGTAASILTGDSLPILTNIVVSGVNAIQQQVQYVNVGVNLQIQPRISSDGYVTSHLFSEVSSVTAFSQGYPQISQRQASTSATVKDGESFVIGGLLKESEISNMSKIPILGDLPVLGTFFRVRHDSSQATNLYIIVTPHIVASNPGR